jgi:trehalose 6-phosphate synthase/phosphatase
MPLPLRLVKFRVVAKLEHGLSLHVSGKCEGLGGEHLPGVQLHTTPESYPVWVSETLSLPSSALEYGYVVTSGGVLWKRERSPSVPQRCLPANLLCAPLTVEDQLEDLTLRRREEPSGSDSDPQPAYFPAPTPAIYSPSAPPLTPAKTAVLRPGAGLSVVVVSCFLPVILTQEGEGDSKCWHARWDGESILALPHLVRQFGAGFRVTWVGTVRQTIPDSEEERAAIAKVLAALNCLPVFASPTLFESYYDMYCKGTLWPVLHHILPAYDMVPVSLMHHQAGTAWSAYRKMNMLFRDKVVEAYNEGDLIWVHGFHLMLLPSFLRREIRDGRIGVFFHTPFPSSELFRTLAQREELLRGMLCADQVGFHRFEYGRHFLNNCRRILGLSHAIDEESGQLRVNYHGRPVVVTTVHCGLDPTNVGRALDNPEVARAAREFQRLHEGRRIIAGIERMERLKGVWLKLLAFERLLSDNPSLRGKVCMHEIGIRARERRKDYESCRELVTALTQRINDRFGEGTVTYELREERDMNIVQRAALYCAARVFLKVPVRDGLTLSGMEFRMAQDHWMQQGVTDFSPGALVLSWDTSCSKAMRGALVINPWKLSDLQRALLQALELTSEERLERHQTDIVWVRSQTSRAWAEHVLQELHSVPKGKRSSYTAAGLGLSFRPMPAGFKELDIRCVRPKYRAAQRRLILLDYGGTLALDASGSKRALLEASQGPYSALHTIALREDGGINSPGTVSKRYSLDHTACIRPSQSVIEVLRLLCNDPKNSVFVVSGRRRSELQGALRNIPGLGLAAEHGCYVRLPRREGDGGSGALSLCSEEGGGGSLTSSASRELLSTDWDERSYEAVDENQEGSDQMEGNEPTWESHLPDNSTKEWKEVTSHIMRMYAVRTHGAYVEEKGSAILWHYGDADPEFGAIQAKDLQDQISILLRGQPVEIVHEEGSGCGASGGGGGAYLEVRSPSATKGTFARWALGGGVAEPDFCLCIGDDASDEDMFAAVRTWAAASPKHRISFTATVGGARESEAGAFIPDVAGVLQLLKKLEVPPQGEGLDSPTLHEECFSTERRYSATEGDLCEVNTVPALLRRSYSMDEADARPLPHQGSFTLRQYFRALSTAAQDPPSF